MALVIAEPALEAIRREAVRAYPHEGCGALLGRPEEGVTEVVPLPNVEADEPRVRFLVSPRDYLAVEAEAERRGLGLLGFWHSHPDHPARPSQTDRLYAWPGLLTVIVAVEKGAARELTAWEVAAADQPFREVALAEPERATR